MPSSPGRSRQRRSNSPARGRRSYDPDDRMRRALEAQAVAAEASRKVTDRVAERRNNEWRRAADQNRRRALLVLGVPFVVAIACLICAVITLVMLAVGAFLLCGWAIVAVLVWGSASSGSWFKSKGVATDEAVASGALPALAAERYGDVAESLCSGLGLSLPELRVLVDPAKNAIACGSRPGRARLMVTTGLLAGLERVELEAVLAHELAHIKRLDTLSGGVSAALLHGGRSSLVRTLARWLEGTDREVEADLAAVGITRYPPGLLTALERVVAAPAQRPASVAARLLADSSSQWLVPPVEVGRGEQVSELAPGHFGPEERMQVLREL